MSRLVSTSYIACIIHCILSLSQVVSCVDYLLPLLTITGSSDRHRCLALYICDLCLQYTQLTIHKPARLAASCVVLAHASLEPGTITVAL